MPTRTIVNLPVKDVTRSVGFFKALGFAFEPLFANEQGACIIVGEDGFVMLLDEGYFRTFTRKGVCDTTRSTEVIFCLALEDRARVERMMARAISLGATVSHGPLDHGPMDCESFEDLDGHIWILTHIGPATDGQTGREPVFIDPNDPRRFHWARPNLLGEDPRARFRKGADDA
jgi:predicted lactoylglutathione lyase